ncbi:hypothetical protein [Putridiphycobacter roseus]|uniref:hypothetical protein n=1 Tax=Putridiphycobacter roseus TaxID=2219161 RepID=UPI0011B58B68|nr:hypothetical protein [Putridiphycobacter roseus]
MKLLQLVLLGLTFTLIIACNSNAEVNNNSNQNSENMFFSAIELGASSSETNLLINARFSECGEWGGHEEKMVIYANPDKDFYLDYIRYKVNCDSIGHYYGTPDFQKLDYETTLKLGDDQKKSVSEYIRKMSISKTEERHPGHAGNRFSVVKSDSTLVLDVYDSKEYDENSYYQLLTELNLNSDKN